MKIVQFLFCASLVAFGGRIPVLANQELDSDGTPSGALDAKRVAHSDSIKEIVQPTPLVVQTVRRPIPFKGGDGRYHLVYELQLENYTGNVVSADQLQVLDAGKDTVVAEFTAAQVASRLVVRDARAVAGKFGASQVGLLYLHVKYDLLGNIPEALDHRLTMRSNDSTVSATAAHLPIERPTQLVIDAPLRGKRFIAGDGCCDSTRHVRATLALNGHAFASQRFAIDWEELDSSGRIYAGADSKNPNSYVIYGKPAYAVADARVIAAVDGMENSPIGSFPIALPIDKADGNHVVLDLGGGHYALYAHFAPHSVLVKEGQYVRRGQVLGKVGTSGNSSEPHLHFQVTDGPSTFLSDGVPYLLPKFTANHAGASTKAFDKAIINGDPIETVPLPGPSEHAQELPLDLWIVDLPE
jgi:murein DD-endopeptidase MepM/ murein hydrolase activator NlpD